MGIADADLRGILLAAVLALHLAAVPEVAVVGHVHRVGHAAGNVVQLLHLFPHHRL